MRKASSPTSRHWQRLEERAPELYKELYALYLADMRAYCRKRNKSELKEDEPRTPYGRHARETH